MGNNFNRLNLYDIILILLIFSILQGLFFYETNSFAQGNSHNFLGKEEMMANLDNADVLTEDEGRYLISVARSTIEQRLLGTSEKVQDAAGLSPKFSDRRGTFVTLTIHKQLRGCIGHIIPQESIIEGIRVNAINAAFRDPRFPPLSKEEFKNVDIEISILTEPKELYYDGYEDLLEKLRPSVDGVILKKGFHQATFLPQVWEQLPDKKEFLNHLCLKAGLSADAWEKERLDVLVYQVQAFEEAH